MTPRTIDYLPLPEVVPASRNPKQHDLETLRASVDRFGFVEPMVLDERTGKLVSGHGRLETLAAAAFQEVDPPDGVQVDDDGTWLVPVVRGWSSKNDAEAEALLVAVNELTSRGGWEQDELAGVLADLLAEDPTLLAVTGFTTDELDDMLAHLEPPSLDDLEDKYGEPDPQQLWPVLRFKVSPPDRDRYLRLVEGVEGGDDVLFAHLLDLAERP